MNNDRMQRLFQQLALRASQRMFAEAGGNVALEADASIEAAELEYYEAAIEILHECLRASASFLEERRKEIIANQKQNYQALAAPAKKEPITLEKALRNLVYFIETAKYISIKDVSRVLGDYLYKSNVYFVDFGAEINCYYFTPEAIQKAFGTEELEDIVFLIHKLQALLPYWLLCEVDVFEIERDPDEEYSPIAKRTGRRYINDLLNSAFYECDEEQVFTFSFDVARLNSLIFAFELHDDIKPDAKPINSDSHLSTAAPAVVVFFYECIAKATNGKLEEFCSLQQLIKAFKRYLNDRYLNGGWGDGKSTLELALIILKVFLTTGFWEVKLDNENKNNLLVRYNPEIAQSYTEASWRIFKARFETFRRITRNLTKEIAILEAMIINAMEELL